MKTSNLVVLLIFFLVFNNLMAQEFQGIATYKSHRKVDLKMDDENANSEMQKSIQAQLSKQFQREYTLKFNKNESIYEQEEKLDAPMPAQSGFIIKVSQSSGVLYKNIKENRFADKSEIYGKVFLIKDSLKNKKWELVNDTKNIGTYTCFKATYTEDYETQTLNNNGKFEDTTQTRTITAWYAPQIPVSNGPSGYFGLPGLILEVNDGKLILICNKIVINPKESFTIEEPTKGKMVTQKEFDAVMDKKFAEMMEQFRSKRGRKGDNVVIKISG
tara:strand:+ start:4123 stop:4941 length:819 start_codon:yes stop_codon:yes gene_type:complete